MENTGKVLLEIDKVPQWYVAKGDHWVGPLTATEVYEKILSQEISWAHYVWKAGQADWKRICDLKTFQAAVPALPEKSVQTAVKAAAVPAQRKGPPPGPAKAATQKKEEARPPEKSWFLFYSESQFGPFSEEEVSRFLRIGKIHGRVFAWCDGMADWERLEKISLFTVAVGESKKARKERRTGSEPSNKQERSEQRDTPRRPLVARILLADNREVNVAVCRDISIGGMQVLTDQVPGEVGTRLKMNVSPARGERNRSITPFVAEGIIVRILEDGRGFSFRFERLSNDAKQVIDEYIATTFG
jgi:hypothetical protein